MSSGAINRRRFGSCPTNMQPLPNGMTIPC
jgi:hypothetical protein